MKNESGEIADESTKITLKEVEFVEVEGEYEQRFINKQNYPAFLTNYALKRDKKKGSLLVRLLLIL